MEQEISSGDLILTKKYVKGDKFDDLYDGPFRVHDVKGGTVIYAKGNKLIKVHKNFIKKASADYGDGPPEPFPIIELDEDDMSELCGG